MSQDFSISVPEGSDIWGSRKFVEDDFECFGPEVAKVFCGTMNDMLFRDDGSDTFVMGVGFDPDEKINIQAVLLPDMYLKCPFEGELLGLASGLNDEEISALASELRRLSEVVSRLSGSG